MSAPFVSGPLLGGLEGVGLSRLIALENEGCVVRVTRRVDIFVDDVEGDGGYRLLSWGARVRAPDGRVLATGGGLSREDAVATAVDNAWVALTLDRVERGAPC